ncbi:MAG: aspartate aminotransferase [Omnitrophica bacterium RIFCSPHIGHO2_02_FULL_46_11]|nr:MAG: aspartate aminotransferase [Omnitrophica bacterium RIFCSPLOWO2_01_FULL_45_10b]OGW86586.1 MAG: aspartate aminotransferase [Omnitrophica bacterium RIFCSPHIGHO2_02_FULL_46_11]
MKLAKRIQKVTPSLTLAIEAKAKRLKQEGVDIISFSAGEPDFDTPLQVKQAAIESLNKGFTKYTPASGMLELRKAISEKLSRENHLAYSPDQIVVSCGAKHSIYNMLQVLIEEGDEVIILSPFWLSFPEMVTLAGGTSVILKTEFENGYVPSPRALEKLITKKTKLLILNSPSNPTGAVMTKELLKEIAAIAKKHSFFILSDEIYEKLIFDGGTHYSIGSLDPAILERTITVGGASKSYAMTGWRLGFSASAKPIAEACGALQSHSTSNPTSFAQAGYLEALKTAEADVQNMRATFEKRRDLIFRLVSDIPKLKPFKPSGAFYLFTDISGTKLPSLQFADRLLDEAKVAVVPGVAFGDDHTIRISFATSEKLIEAGIVRIREWLKKI